MGFVGWVVVRELKGEREMGRTPCCDKRGLKKGPWTAEEDEILVNYIKKNNGHGSWRSLPKLAGFFFFFSLKQQSPFLLSFSLVWLSVNLKTLCFAF